MVCAARRFRAAAATKQRTDRFENAIGSEAMSAKMPIRPTGPKQTAVVAAMNKMDKPTQYEAKNVSARRPGTCLPASEIGALEMTAQPRQTAATTIRREQQSIRSKFGFSRYDYPIRSEALPPWRGVPAVSWNMPLDNAPKVVRQLIRWLLFAYTLAVQRFLVRLIAACAALLWVLPMHSSLWLDETGTFWIAKDRISDTIERAWFWSGQSPFYYLIAWLAVRVGGTSEIILRTPSLVCMAGATAILVFAGARLIDRETGLLGALVFVCFEETVFAAADARPYALALLMLVAQMLMLLRWLDRGRFRDAAAYAVLAALTVYAHPLFATGLVAPAVYALWRSTRKLAVAATWIATAVLCLPLAPQLLDFYRNRQMKTFASTPRANQFFESLTPATASASILAGLLLAYLLIPGITVRWAADRPKTMLLTAWAAFTPAVYFALGLFTDIKLFVPRYCLSMAPGLALLAGCAMRSFAPERARRIMACSLALTAVAAFGVLTRFNHGGQDWRGAMRAVRSVAGGTDMPVLVVSRFVEALEPAKLADPRLRDILFSPLLIYPPAGKVVRLPPRVDREYLDQVVNTVLRNQSSFLMVDFSDSPVPLWLGGRLEPQAPSVQRLGNFGLVDVRLIRLNANALPAR